VGFDYRYDKSLKPRGTLTLRYSGGTFTGRDPVWIVQVGSVAIVQTTGTLNGATRSARLRFDDNAEPPRPDTFRAKLGSYDSGTVTVTSWLVALPAPSDGSPLTSPQSTMRSGRGSIGWPVSKS
jgi:hypothetical protein